MSGVLLNSSNFSIYYKMIDLFLLVKAKTFLSEGFDSNKRARIEEFEFKISSFRR